VRKQVHVSLKCQSIRLLETTCGGTEIDIAGVQAFEPAAGAPSVLEKRARTPKDLSTAIAGDHIAIGEVSSTPEDLVLAISYVLHFQD
jgi:hypothetical protein